MHHSRQVRRRDPHRMRRGAPRTAVALAALLAVTACGAPMEGVPAAPAGEPSTGPSSTAAWSGCRASGFTGDWSSDEVDLAPLGDVDPVEAVRCVSDQRRAGGAEVLFAVEERTSDVAELVAALRRADEPRRDDVACTADAWLPPWLLLIDATGRVVRPRIPRDVCAKPMADFTAAYGRAVFVETAAEPLRTVRTAEAVAAGCEQQQTDLVRYAVEVEMAPAAPGPIRPPDGTLRICRYVVDGGHDETGNDGGGDKEVGAFDSGVATVPDDAAARLRRALAGVTEAPRACSDRAEHFAVVLTGSTAEGQPGSGSRQVYVELDGCRRLVVVDDRGHAVGQADRDLVELLRG